MLEIIFSFFMQSVQCLRMSRIVGRLNISLIQSEFTTPGKKEIDCQ